MRYAALYVLTLGFATTLSAADQHSLTIYSKASPGAVDPSTYVPAQGNPSQYRGNIPGYAMVRTRRLMEMPKGRGTASFSDVAAGIDPTTVRFRSLSDPETRVIEQNYQFDLVSTQKLLETYLGERIEVEQVIGDNLRRHVGELLSADAGVVLRDDDGQVRNLRHFSSIAFPELPGGLLIKPTLLWELRNSPGSEQQIEVSYETKGMTWWADYNLAYDESNGCELDLNAWVSVLNQSGGSFPGAKLKLIAGDIHRAPRSGARYPGAKLQRMAAAVADEEGFQEKSFFEYHMYTLPRPTNLPDRSTKQLELFPAVSNIGCEKRLILMPDFVNYLGSSSPYTDRYQVSTEDNPKIWLRFANSKDNNMGIPMPAGRIRVAQKDPADGSLELIGEDVIKHTPRNEEIEIQLGKAFDVMGERSQTNFAIDTTAHWIRESFEVQIRNQKSEPVTIEIREPLFRWSNWEIERHSHDFEKLNARLIAFTVDIAPESSETVRYTVHYTW